MQTTTFPWQKLVGDVKVKCVYGQKDGSFVGLGLDGNIMTRASLASEWVLASQIGQYQWVAPMRDGSVLAVGQDGFLYVLASVTSGYSLIQDSGTVKSAAQLCNGTIIAIGSDGKLYTRPTLTSGWILVPNTANMLSVQVLADDTIVSAGTDNNLYAWAPLTGSFAAIPGSGAIIAAGECTDGSILGVGTDTFLYRSPRFSVSAPTAGYTPMDFGDDQRNRVDPAPAFYQFGTDEQRATDDALSAAFGGAGTPNYIAKRPVKQNWLGVAGEYSFPSLDAYKLAWTNLIAGLIGKPYSTTKTPATTLDASCFVAVSGFAAYFVNSDSDLTPKHLRVFATTPFYKGPGRYEILCGNKKVVTVVIDRDDLIGKSYKFVNRNSGMVLTVKDGNTAAGAALVQANDNGSAGQIWYLRLTNDRGYKIQSALSEKYIDVDNHTSASGALINLWIDNRNLCQQWRLVATGGGYRKIVSAYSGKNLDVPNNSTAAGVQLVQWDDNGNGTNQQWMLVPVS